MTHIVFVQTPMATEKVSERERYWANFDVRYHAAHPGLRHMENVLWELPHWMTWLAGVLIDEGFTSVEALDLYAAEFTETGLNVPKLEHELRGCPGDVFLLSPMTPNLPIGLEIADVIKGIYPKSKVVMGGVVATPLHREIALHPSIDYVVFGRGERALPELIRAIEGKVQFSDLRNLSAQMPSGEVVSSLGQYLWMPVNQIPKPKIDLFGSEVGGDLRYLRQVYALGCPYKCSFCTIGTIGQKADYFHVDRVLNEIHAYRSHYGEHHNVYFGDETFTIHKKRTMDICSALEADGTIQYDIQTRLNCLEDTEVLEALKNSGCSWVEIGIETINQTSQNEHKQRMKLAELEETLKRVQDAGLTACSYLVNGFPDQTIDDMKGSIDYVSDLIDRDLLQTSYLFGLVPYPGSDLYAQPEKYGMKLLHKDFRRYHEDLPPVYETKYAKPDEMYEVFLNGVRQLGDAMGGPSASLELASVRANEPLENFGQFWSGAHQ